MLITSISFVTVNAHQSYLGRLMKITRLSSIIRMVHTQHAKGLRLVRYLMDSWFGAALGGGVYGAWAVWANWAQGAHMALQIGAAHWLTSALLTYFGTMAMRRFYGNAGRQSDGLRAFAGGLTLTYASLLAVHGFLGTEQLLLTLLPGVIPNILFCASYALLLQRTATTKTP